MTTDHKIIGGIGLVTIGILVGGVLLLSRNPANTVPEGDFITRSGLHWHPKVTVFIKGEKQAFPNGIGLNGAVHDPIHTHDDADKDIVHMEFGGLVKKANTKLGAFFQIWGKNFSSTTLFDKTNGDEGIIKMTINGKENTAFDNYLMKDGDSIEVRYE